MWAKQKTNGFTIVELLIVIVVIAILASISVVAYSGITNKAKTSKRDNDIATYTRAIMTARTNDDKMLKDITGSTWSAGSCAVSSGNTGNVEPRDLPKTHICWTRYYDNLTKIAAAANTNLDGLRDGDPRGNPYILDENEGEACSQDLIATFTGNGTAAYSTTRYIPRYAINATC
jgi:prepilin-type N-terminal cleavage/methylation domain-containing protein